MKDVAEANPSHFGTISLFVNCQLWHSLSLPTVWHPREEPWEPTHSPCWRNSQLPALCLQRTSKCAIFLYSKCPSVCVRTGRVASRQRGAISILCKAGLIFAKSCCLMEALMVKQKGFQTPPPTPKSLQSKNRPYEHKYFISMTNVDCKLYLSTSLLNKVLL